MELNKKEYMLEYNKINKERLVAQRKEYREKNRDAILIKKKEYRDSHKKLIAENDKKYQQINKKELSEKAKKRYENNKDIVLDKQKEYRELNKEKISQVHKIYRNSHKELTKIYMTSYYNTNKNALIENVKEYRENHIEETNITHKKWRLNNPDKANVSGQKYRAKKRELPHTLTLEQWKTIKQKFNNKCAYCGKELPLAQEHFIALSKGGEFTTNNIICACRSCNSSKGNRDFFTWYPTYKHYSKKREKIILKFLGYTNEVQQLKII